MKLQKNHLIFLLTVTAILAGLIFFIKNSPAKINTESKLQITTSFYPLYYFTTQIGGDKVNVINITPSGAEPHDYEPSTSDIVNIESSGVLVLNGEGLESWGDKIKNILNNKSVTIVETARGLTSGHDPHIWLDPNLAKIQSSRVLETLALADPVNKNYYTNNFNKLSKNLDTLDAEFKKGLATCVHKNIVTSHAAFGYLADRYRLTQIPIAGLSPDAEPSPKQMAQITDLVKSDGIKYIFFEELISPSLAQTIASETNAKTISFNPLEGLTPDEEKRGEDYIFLQRQNLKNLKIALECK